MTFTLDHPFARPRPRRRENFGDVVDRLVRERERSVEKLRKAVRDECERRYIEALRDFYAGRGDR